MKDQKGQNQKENNAHNGQSSTQKKMTKPRKKCGYE